MGIWRPVFGDPGLSSLSASFMPIQLSRRTSSLPLLKYSSQPGPGAGYFGVGMLHAAVVAADKDERERKREKKNYAGSENTLHINLSCGEVKPTRSMYSASSSRRRTSERGSLRSVVAP
eukprot:1159394-Pelagomonas_calceolata.AAC.24